MNAQNTLKLLEGNAKMIHLQLKCTEKLLEEMANERNRVFLCEKCGNWKRRRMVLQETTVETGSDDGRTLHEG